MERLRMHYQDNTHFVDGFKQCFDELVSKLYDADPMDVLACIDIECDFPNWVNTIVLEWIMPLVMECTNSGKDGKTAFAYKVNQILDTMRCSTERLTRGFTDSPDDNSDNEEEDLVWISDTQKQNLPPPKLCRMAVANLKSVTSSIQSMLS